MADEADTANEYAEQARACAIRDISGAVHGLASRGKGALSARSRYRKNAAMPPLDAPCA